MDLLSSIRKEGSRGGVDFKWSDVETSQHRENYLGHSLKAPVGRWQRNKDLSWYAKPDSDRKVLNKDGKEETEAERNARERKEEIRRVKEAEEDALARALGLPVPERNGLGTGANNIDVGEMKRVIKETEAGDDEIDEVGRGRRFGEFVGKVGNEGADDTEASPRNEHDQPEVKTEAEVEVEAEAEAAAETGDIDDPDIERAVGMAEKGTDIDTARTNAETKGGPPIALGKEETGILPPQDKNGTVAAEAQNGTESEGIEVGIEVGVEAIAHREGTRGIEVLIGMCLGEAIEKGGGARTRGQGEVNPRVLGIGIGGGMLLERDEDSRIPYER